MFYAGASLTNNCCNTYVEIFDDWSNNFSWYTLDFPSYTVLQCCQGLGIIVVDLFLEVPQENEVDGIEIRGVE